MTKHFLLGYGSLIDKDSREKTGHSKEATAVRVKGLERGWNNIVSCVGLTAVGVTSKPESVCNGVIVEVPEDDLPKFDEREIGYSRVEFGLDRIIPVENKEISQGKFWVYVVDNPQASTKECPIAQSYVDVILTGCLKISEEFAREFISTTKGWNNPWVNDRQKPRYPRAMKNPDIEKIDTLLKEVVPSAFKKRVKSP